MGIVFKDGSVVWIYGGLSDPSLTEDSCPSIIRSFFDVFIFVKAAFICFVSIRGIMLWSRSKFMRC